MIDIVSLGEPLYEFSELPGGNRQWLQGFGGDTMNCVIAAARQGARVGIGDVDSELCRQTASDLGENVRAYELDVTSRPSFAANGA